ncbi:hypothetical protein AMTRI_Chr05g58460 [Amborella trichopoda]|uniref:Acid phosphatase n=1 Tax=Amborella trichopoda TaxID=13333 RepID=U5D1D1_AMBTC|nr:acid phosphatase 1 [Amborella trichopoda]ERN15207.1 hypothetical protein AMTR_s00056p00177520 [Amborella trichopoda]|eukprot:XP_006853740.1 acid phosphatase 1 [Amborella trichopoda]
MKSLLFLLIPAIFVAVNGREIRQIVKEALEGLAGNWQSLTDDFTDDRKIRQIMLRNRQYDIPGGRETGKDTGFVCDSWRFAVETNNLREWKKVPDKCQEYVGVYMTGDRYESDSEIVSGEAENFARNISILGDGKDVWVFDIDETLLSNLPYYAENGFGSKDFNEDSFNEWVVKAEAPALPYSLKLYNELKKLGFRVILLTGREESQRTVTAENLIAAGYDSWERLILRGAKDSGKPAVVYKSEKRMEIEGEGYRIHGNSGDQWSDLLGFAIGNRSFKLPNPMYYIS